MRWTLFGVCVACASASTAFAEGDATTGASAAVPTSDPSRWPEAVFDRPLTLPSGLLAAGPDVMTTTSLAETADVAFGYGVTDELEINTLTPTYGLALGPDHSVRGALDLGVGYKLLRGALGGKLEVIGRAVGGYDLAASATRPVRLGLQVQLNVTSKIAIVSHDIGAGNAGVNIGVDGMTTPSFVTLPIGVALQAAPNLWLEADTALVSSAKLNSAATNAFVADVSPVFVTGIYNTLAGRLDVLGYVGCNDAQHASDTIFFGAGARYYVGKL